MTGAYKSAAVFCSASEQVAANYFSEAQEVGRQLALAEWNLVYGGGRSGLMGALAQGSLSAGGSVHGVIPQALLTSEGAHTKIAHLEIVQTLAERKQRMADLSAVFIALPGGYGTFDELIEMMTWRQLGYHNKPIFLLNADGFWNPWLELVGHLKNKKFLHGDELHFSVVETIDELMNQLAIYAKLCIERSGNG